MTASLDNRPVHGAADARAEDVDCSGFLAACERLFAIGVLYPAGHARCIEVTTALLREIRRLPGGASVLTIDAGREALAIQGRLVPLQDRSAQRLHEILQAIGVFRVEIDGSVAPDALHALAGRLLRAKHDADTALVLRRLDLTGLPPSIRLHAREFGRRCGGAEGLALRSDQVRRAAAQAMQELEGRGIDEETRAGLRGLTEQFLQGLAERLELHAPTTEGVRPAFTRSLDEVLGLGIRAVRRALEHALPGGEIGELQKLFSSAELALALAPDAQAVELMVDILSESADDGAAPESTPAEIAGDAGCFLTLEELRARLDTEEARQPLPPWVLVDRAEQIAVLGQLLLRAPGAEALAGAARRLETCVRRSLAPHEREILESALAALLECEDTRVVDGALPHLLPPFRRSGGSFPLLAAVCRKTPSAGLRAVWPHVVNELLLATEAADPFAQRELRRIAAGLPEDEMRRALPRLEALEAMREDRFGTLLFAPPDVELWPLFAVLLGSSRADVIGPRLLAAARSLPSSWPGAPALIALGEYEPRHRPFLAKLLREVGAGAASPELLAAAGRILAERLRALTPAERTARWVPGAIRGLAILPAPGAVELLDEILRRRRLLLLKLWPAACREAAAQALRVRASLEAPADGAPADRARETS